MPEQTAVINNSGGGVVFLAIVILLVLGLLSALVLVGNATLSFSDSGGNRAAVLGLQVQE